MNQNNPNVFNVFSKNQQGGITAGQVFLGKPQRTLNASLASQLDGVLSQHQSHKIDVTAIMGDQEAFIFANEILNYLKSKGRDVDGVNQAIFSGPVVGNNVELGNGTIRIIIGQQQ